MPNPHRPAREVHPVNQHATIRVPSLKGETREGHASARKMCRWLKSKPHGAFRVLHSAAALRSRHGLHGSKKRFQKAYDYLAHRLRYLNYRRHRQCHLPIGSGVTGGGAYPSGRG